MSTRPGKHTDPAARPPRRATVTWRHPGGKKPTNVKLIGRTTRWGNPHRLAEHGPCPVPRCQGALHSRAASLQRFREDLRADPARVAAARRELRGYDLACPGCKLDEDCHGDIWLAVVNEGAAP